MIRRKELLLKRKRSDSLNWSGKGVGELRKVFVYRSLVQLIHSRYPVELYILMQAVLSW